MTSEYFFDGQRDGERVVSVWQRNPATMLRQGLIVVALSLLVSVAYARLGASAASSLLLGAWLIAVPLLSGLTWYRWANDLYILTSQRLVDVDQRSPVYRTVAEVPLGNIQDVAFERRGLLQTMLNYGTVMVQTASVTTRIDIVGVTDPQAVQQVILRTVAEEKKQLSADRTKSDASVSHPTVRTQLG